MDSDKEFMSTIKRFTEYQHRATREFAAIIRTGINNQCKFKIEPQPSQINPSQVEKTKTVLNKCESINNQTPDWSALYNELKLTDSIISSPEFNLYKKL